MQFSPLVLNVFKCDAQEPLTDVGKRYAFSNYIIDPNKHNFSTVVRILAYVYKFINSIRNRLNERSLQPLLDQNHFIQSENYFFRKGTSEVKEFVNSKKYENISVEKNEILYYTGRLLPTDTINFVTPLAMHDLAADTF